MSDINNTEMSNRRTGTIAVWGGETRPSFQGATQTPVVHSVTFGYEDMDEWFDVALGRKEGHIYSRNTNPTVAVFEEKVRLLEHAEAATSFATGMGAISSTLYALLSPGERVVSIKDSYGGTSKIFMEFLPRFGVEVDLCETTDHEALEREIKKGCKVLYLESPTNPTLKVLDLERLINTAHRAGAIVVVDNTFATPVNQNPLDLGADLVLHSATKFLGGHSDAMGGVICGGKDLIQQIFHFREIHGASLDANSAFLLTRGIKTLELRIERHNDNALSLAQFLEGHPKVESVYYPGLESHPFHQIAKKQMRGFGGVLAFNIAGGFKKAKMMLNRLQLVHLAASLGSTGTLAGPPKVTSHVETTAEERKQLGIPEGLVRCSVGIENKEDILSDFESALAKI